MYFCYIDESGTPETSGQTSHYVLAGLAIKVSDWKKCETEIAQIKKKFRLENAEIHTGWILKKYSEQDTIIDFEKLNDVQRIAEVQRIRTTELIKFHKKKTTKGQYKQKQKNYRLTTPYIHLSYDERKGFIKEIAKAIGRWGFARLFAECIDKTFFKPSIAVAPIDEQAFEQIVSRFEQFLNKYGQSQNTIEKEDHYGVLIHDNNETVVKKHTALMKSFHLRGTIWTKINRIIETPIFVNSELTSMIQLADVCAYSIRRYLENGEEVLFDEIYKRADKIRRGTTVGVRHFAKADCKCKICSSHKKTT
ncbi:MAG: DUF3800 domain-containing protein [Ignavibacteria bacterium]|nr:DUF3800 domain-containing protein [Ignavibacteria bacterium]